MFGAIFLKVRNIDNLWEQPLDPKHKTVIIERIHKDTRNSRKEVPGHDESINFVKQVSLQNNRGTQPCLTNIQNKHVLAYFSYEVCRRPNI